jgi:hypothetical protein
MSARKLQSVRSLGFALLLSIVTSSLAFAATPAATLKISETSRTAAASGGPFLVPNQSYTAALVVGQTPGGNSDSFICDDAANPCYIVQLDVDLPTDYASAHPTDKIRITASWDPQASDLDMHVYEPPYDTASGRPFHSSRNNPPTPELVEFAAPSGKTSYRIFIVPSAPAAASATVTVSLLTGPPSSGPSNVTLGGPTFVSYNPPATVTTRGDGVSEPTMGVNIGTNKAYMLFTYDVLEAAFDDSTTPAMATWRNLGTGGAPATADPFMTVDQHRLPDGSVNDRVWIAQLLAASSYMAWNSSSGTSSTWTRSLTGPGQVHGVDNQSIAAGPYPNNTKPSTARSDANYPHALYYCSHSGVNAFCSRSDDGGLTFNTSKPIFPLDGNCSNHGHVKVGGDGTVYVPMNNSCGGHEGVSLSIDAGETWHYISVPGTTNGRWDSSIAIANDGKTIWYGYGEEGDDRPMIIKGTLDKSDPANPTIQWQEPAVDVGAPAGLTNIVFPTVVAGDPDRAAMIFHGTTTEGDSGDMASFPASAEWYLWVATTTDGGRNWQLSNATPNDPTQKGSICDRGTACDNQPDDRNLLDFMDADIDGEGRILIGYADGCVDNCVAAGPNSFSQRGYIARQATGKRMYARFDPAPPSNLPAAPALTATRNTMGTNLNWSMPTAGTTPIASFLVERNANGGGFRSLATLTGTATKYEDGTAIDTAAAYQYRVSATNAYGAGPASNVVAPTLPQQNICTPPGLTVLTDGTGDSVNIATLAGQQVGVPGPAVTDLTLLTVSQPYLPGGALSLTFQLRTASGGTLPPDTVWFVSFRNPSGVAYAVRMVTDATGTAHFESYKVGAANDGTRRGDFVEGTPKPAAPGSGYAPTDGLITIVVAGSDVGVTTAGTSITGLLSISAKLAGVSVPSSPLTSPGFTGLSQPLDLMPNDGIGTGSVPIVSVATCGPNQAPLAVLSALLTNHNPMVVAFDASRSFDPDASSPDPQLRDTIVKYVFDFGDGTPPLATTNPRVTHQYPAGNGTWGASLRVQDSRGKASAGEATKQICQTCLKKK